MTIKSIGLIAALAFVAAACGTKEAPGPLEPGGPTGRVRFVNLINDPARIPVNAILESLPFGVNLGYGATTPATLPSPSNATYSPILTGSRTLVLKKTADTTVVVATYFVDISENTDYTVYATGGVGGAPVTFFSVINTNPVPTASQVEIRIVNYSPAAGAIDVFITAPNADLSAATPTVSSPGAPDPGTSYVVFAPGTYQVRAVPAGTAPAARSTSVVLTINNLVLAGGTGRTIVIADRAAGGAPITGFVLTDR
jgi:Domain of unknown function (DUF4397)